MADLNSTLVERKSRYGEFKDHAVLCMELKETMRCWHGWTNLEPYQQQALEVIMDKVARILNGDPDYADNWHDIQGYAKLVEDRLPNDQ